MRTTLVIDDDVMAAARAIADHQHSSIGRVLSDLARKALHAPEVSRTRNGISLLPTKAGVVVTQDIVNALRDEAP
ncbi:hypothetical protein JQK15_25825 [Sphingobium sp. BHU LFT2]|uniref:hypothetical protein n=1 Tax=Sphingobium sp. BHU LFT2 TaxID=2807634 RepID=UPI001BE8AA8B|nr:hypothetical protein [Sphingobium sp. BHU LFT2]MBT2246917.1 hypothetical protein [Sphingobium sp. BHU LFT2]